MMRVPKLRRTIMNYRLYLLDDARNIRAGESFVAEDDSRAIGIAITVYSSCSDAFNGYELWKQSVKLADERNAYSSQHWWAITQASQREVLDLEDRMQRTFACLSESRQLLDASSKLRGRITDV